MDSRLTPLQAGDHVYIGLPRPGKVHWEILTLSADRTRAALRSPMSSIVRLEDTAVLTLHTSATATATRTE